MANAFRGPSPRDGPEWEPLRSQGSERLGDGLEQACVNVLGPFRAAKDRIQNAMNAATDVISDTRARAGLCSVGRDHLEWAVQNEIELPALVLERPWNMHTGDVESLACASILHVVDQTHDEHTRKTVTGLAKAARVAHADPANAPFVEVCKLVHAVNLARVSAGKLPLDPAEVERLIESGTVEPALAEDSRPKYVAKSGRFTFLQAMAIHVATETNAGNILDILSIVAVRAAMSGRAQAKRVERDAGLLVRVAATLGAHATRSREKKRDMERR